MLSYAEESCTVAELHCVAVVFRPFLVVGPVQFGVSHCVCPSEAVPRSYRIYDLVILENRRIQSGNHVGPDCEVVGNDGRPLAAQLQQNPQLRMFGNEFLPDFSRDCFQLKIFPNINGFIQALELRFVWRDVSNVIEEFIRNCCVLSPAIEDDLLPLQERVLRCRLDQTHWSFLLEEEVVATIDYLFEGGFDVLLAGVLHVGSPVDHNRILAMLVDIDICRAGMLVGEHTPVQLYVGSFHLCFESSHGVIVADLSDEVALTCQFSGGNCLVSPLSAIGSEILEGLHGLPLDWYLLDVQEVVSVGTSENTNLFTSLHSIL